MGWRGVGEPNGSCIHEKAPDKRHIGDKYGFLLLTAVGTSKGLENVDTASTYDLAWRRSSCRSFLSLASCVLLLLSPLLADKELGAISIIIFIQKSNFSRFVRSQLGRMKKHTKPIRIGYAVWQSIISLVVMTRG